MLCAGLPITSEKSNTQLYTSDGPRAEPRDSDMDLSRTGLIESTLAGGEMGARMRALASSATVLGPLPNPSLAARHCKDDASLVRIEPEEMDT